MRGGLDKQYPALWHLMGAYLHQDYEWTGTIDENIKVFIAESSGLPAALPEEVERALTEYTTEEDLDALVGALGCQVLPPDNLTHRAWLLQIAAVVRDALPTPLVATLRSDSPLSRLVGAYLNQELWDTYPDVMAGVDAFLKDEPGLAEPLVQEIDRLLVDAPTEDELDDLMRQLGAGFLPRVDGYRGWLERIAARVRATRSG